MPAVILQPCGSSGARQHYNDTIKNIVPLDQVSPYLSATEQEFLEQLHPDKRLLVWGVTPGKSGQQISKWERIEPGDVTLFSRNKQIFASATVTYKTHNPELALSLWGRDESDQTWEYVYFLNELKNHAIPYPVFNAAVGYQDNFVIQGFNILNEEKSDRVLTAFDLESDDYFPEVSREEFEKSFDGVGNLDRQTKGTARVEQSYLRDTLFGKKHLSECSLCGSTLPTSFLVAAHIKKRAECSLEEKVDAKNIVAAMCKLGCDELYEKGYLVVDEGTIRINSQKSPVTDRLAEIMRSLDGQVCHSWTDENKHYFKWHQEFHGWNNQR